MNSITEELGLITIIKVFFFIIIAKSIKLSHLNENYNNKDVLDDNIKSSDNTNMLNTSNEINSKNRLLKENEGMDLPHKYQIDLPHIQKIYDEENNNYIRNYYQSRSMNENKISIENLTSLKNYSYSIKENSDKNIAKYEIIEKNKIIDVNTVDIIQKEKPI